MDSQENQNARVFVGNVAPDTDPDLIEQHFKTHGNVTGVAVHKGYSFVQFELAAEAHKAIEKENGAMFLGKRIDVKPAKITKRSEQEPSSTGPPPGAQQQAPYEEQDQGDYQQDYDSRGGRHYDNYNENQGYHPRGRGRGRGRGGYNDYPPRGNSFRGRGGGRGDYGGGRGDYGGGRGDYSGGRGDYGGGRGGYGRGRGRGGHYDTHYDEPYYNEQEFPHAPTKFEPVNTAPNQALNDCEIVCVSRNQRGFAERIESRLKMIGMKVDVLFPNPKVDLAKIMGNIASRGVYFALLITPLNEDHNSVTLNILQGQQQEHRNMPLEDAVTMMAKVFEKGLDQPAKPPNQQYLPNQDDPSKMPQDVKNVFGFLMDNRPLSVMEFDKLIRYLVNKREDMLKSEYGANNIPANLLTPPIGPPLDASTKARQDELQAKILDILNKKKEPELSLKPAASSAPAGPAPGLSASLQKAIDSLIKTGPNLLSGGNSSSSNYGGDFPAYGRGGGY